MKWRLEAVLRIRADAEERAAVAHARAVAALRDAEAAASVLADAWRAAAARHEVGRTSVASLLEADTHRRALEARARAEQARAAAALQGVAVARAAHLAARRERHILELIRDREQEQRRRARDGAEDDALAEWVGASWPAGRSRG